MAYPAARNEEVGSTDAHVCFLDGQPKQSRRWTASSPSSSNAAGTVERDGGPKLSPTAG